MFITFEGGEGTGKTTLINRLKKHFEEQGKVIVVTREPGGSMITEKIRNLLLDPKNTDITYHTETLLYAASRAQHLDEVIIPALKENKLVLCDRYLDSSLAYQGYARKLGYDFVLKINNYATRYIPDITFYIDLDPNIGLNRILNRINKDRLDMEEMDFHKLVREGYLDIAKLYPNRIIKIRGNQAIESIINAVLSEIKERLW